MDQRLTEFVAALRACGVRVSVAESIDALRALESTRLAAPHTVRLALQATLVKDAADQPVFARLYPLFFEQSAPPLPAEPGADLHAADRAWLQQQVTDFLATVEPGPLQLLLAAMLSGRDLDAAEREALLAPWAAETQLAGMFLQSWATRRALRVLQFEQLDALLDRLLEQLRAADAPEEWLMALQHDAAANRDALAEQIRQRVGVHLTRRELERSGSPSTRELDEDRLYERSLAALSPDETAELRQLVATLAIRLRSQAALRRHARRRGTFDARRTIRTNLRYHGIPLEIRRRQPRLKPKLTLICDLSGSVRTTAEFMLLLVYTLHDQLPRTRSFGFISSLRDISAHFEAHRPVEALAAVRREFTALYESTDLGAALATFAHEHLATVDRRTTVLIFGDGRNNYADPNLHDLALIKRRARRLIWFNPESPRQWGTGDSAMAEYIPCCDAVHHVGNLRQLAAAVESLLNP